MQWRARAREEAINHFRADRTIIGRRPVRAQTSFLLAGALKIIRSNFYIFFGTAQSWHRHSPPSPVSAPRSRWTLCRDRTTYLRPPTSPPRAGFRLFFLRSFFLLFLSLFFFFFLVFFFGGPSSDLRGTSPDVPRTAESRRNCLFADGRTDGRTARLSTPDRRELGPGEIS